MIENWLFVLAVFAVLMIPGPTNALLASSAHQQGIARTSLFIPAEMMGYLYSISLWALVIHLTAPIWPHFITLLHVLSAAYVIWLAFHLWKESQLQHHNQKYTAIRPKQLFFATMKNPKSLLFAAGIFPQNTWDSPAVTLLVLGVFCMMLLPTAIFWMLFGQAILAGKYQQKNADLLYKGSALLLIICMLPVMFRFF
ncbi:LysE family translocator [Acinetobacter chinensis]|uniref:LysE family translocator n=1 Tax=Acinetobacter chinensis TaxID=2004650 RepID=UPI002934A488|nr:threonine transporter RhtB [Acinetobacter chinensis]WOE41694.1 threonine transporter RhtB [Acinetobacter chinensis]